MPTPTDTKALALELIVTLTAEFGEPVAVGNSRMWDTARGRVLVGWGTVQYVIAIGENDAVRSATLGAAPTDVTLPVAVEMARAVLTAK